MFAGPKQINNQDIAIESSTKLESIGSLGVSSDGRIFRYAQAGASALVSGNLTVAPVPAANHNNKAVDAAVAVGDKKVVIASIGATAITADQYADGYLVVQDNAGEGFAYAISGHTAYDASASDVVIHLKDPVEVALTTASEVSLENSPWDGVVIAVVDQLDLPTGIARKALTAAYYGWVQTGGISPVWADETYAVGVDLTIGTGVAGQLEMLDAAGEPRVGSAVRAGVDGEHTLANLGIY